VKKKKELGNCFETANTLALTFMARGVEVGNLVFDYEYQHGFVASRNRYYAAGEVRGGEVKYYTVRDALDEMLKFEHHGPWDEDLIFKEFIPDDFATSCNRPTAAGQ